MSEASILHTREQGLRVHVLANLGGLVAIAGLEHAEPDLLLGAFLEVSERLPQMKPSLAERMRARGATKLDERGSGKRAWRARERGLDLHAVHLTSEQLRLILRALGAGVPARREDLSAALSRALEERSAMGAAGGQASGPGAVTGLVTRAGEARRGSSDGQAEA